MLSPRAKSRGRQHFIFLISCFLFSTLTAQTKNTDKDKPIWKQDTVVGTNIYKRHSNWMSGGAGYAINSSFKNAQFNMGADFNFHITDKYFQAGLFLSGDAFGSYNNRQFHACYGKRKETNSINFAYFGGLSFSSLFRLDGATGLYGSTAESAVGIYGNVQFVKKIKYDIGIGISAFADVNTVQNIFGVRLDVYFSGAYKGRKED